MQDNYEELSRGSRAIAIAVAAAVSEFQDRMLDYGFDIELIQALLPSFIGIFKAGTDGN